MPPNMARLPRDEAGRPIPWFAAVIDGKHDFRVIDARKIGLAVKAGLCWVCGKPLYAMKSFLVGPMCALNRVSAEPPSHLDCARYSARVCPFLITPGKVRRPMDPESGTSLAQADQSAAVVEGEDIPGFMIMRNPGVALVWTTKTYKLELHNGLLFRLGDPAGMEFYAEGRAANRAEIDAAVQSGLPILRERAGTEGPKAVAALEAQLAGFTALLDAA